MRLRISAAAALASACVIATLAGTAPGAAASPADSPGRSPTASPGKSPGKSSAKPPAAPSAEGGQVVYASDGSACTLGFNVRRDDGYYFLTAGACAREGQRVYAESGKAAELGTVIARTGLGIGLVRYVQQKVERPGSVLTYPGSLDIKEAGRVPVGQDVCRSSPVSGRRCGTLQALDLSVMLPDGSFATIARTSACAEPEDAPGAPYYSGGTALGMEFQGSGACGGGDGSYYQPIDEILTQLGGGEIY